MKDTLIKILVAALLIITGIVFIRHPEIDTTKLMMILSIIIFIGAIIEFTGYFMTKEKSSPFLVVEAISFMILGLVIFFNRQKSLESILIAVSIWLILLSGINIIRALRFEKKVVVTWWIPMVWGIVQLIFGALFFYNNFIPFVGTNRYLGIAFILIGIGNLSSIYFTGEHLQKKERDYRRQLRREKYRKKDHEQ